MFNLGAGESTVVRACAGFAEDSSSSAGIHIRLLATICYFQLLGDWTQAITHTSPFYYIKISKNKTNPFF